MAKRMMADVFREAANVYLWDGAGDPREANGHFYSCDSLWSPAWDKSPLILAKSLGCPTANAMQFLDFTEGEQRQGVRYMWLLLAAHYAEDEGLTA